MIQLYYIIKGSQSLSDDQILLSYYILFEYNITSHRLSPPFNDPEMSETGNTFNIPFGGDYADSDQGHSHQILCMYLSKSRLLPTATSTQNVNKGAIGGQSGKDGAWFRKIAPCLNLLVNSRPDLASLEKSEHRGFTETDEMMFVTQKAKVTMLLEVVLDVSGTKHIGYRFWYISKCPDFDFNLGMVNLIRENQVERAKFNKQASSGHVHKPLAGEEYRDMYNIDIFLSAVYHGYTTESYNTKTSGPACFENLMDPSNLLCLTNLFSVESAFNHPDLITEPANALQGSVDSYIYTDATSPEHSTTLKFPIQHMVLDIAIEVGTPTFILNMVLPKVGTLNVSKSPRASMYDDHIKAVQGGNATRIASDVMDTTSELKLFASHNALVYAALSSPDNHKSAVDMVAAITKYRRAKIQEFAYIWGAAIHVSDMLKVMFKYHQSNVTRASEEEGGIMTYSRPIKFCKVIDQGMSPFANFMIRRMDWIQHPYGASTSHLIILFLSFARLDAYRRGLDLHQHFILTGSGNTGKSYCLDVMGKKMCIPNSVEWLTHKTAKADAVDHHQNDRIVLHHEMPDHLLGINKDQGAATGDYMYKSALDSGVVCSKVFHRDDVTGERSNRYSESECISVNGGNTNEPPKNVPDALMQRFSLWMVPEKEIKNGRKIDHFLDPTREIDGTLEKEINKVFRDEQLLVCIVEKLIWVNILPKVNMDLARSVWRDLEHELAPKGVDLTLTRNMARVQLLARSLTILNAIELVFHVPGMNCYGKPFEWGHFLELIPYMVCTEEIAITAITEMSEQYMMSGETTILCDVATHICHYPPPIDYEGYSADNDVEKETTWKTHKDGCGVIVADYNFVEVKGSLWGVATQAHKFAGRTKHSVANINLLLWRLEKRKIRAKRYTGYGVQETVYSDMPILEQSQNKDAKIYINTHYLQELFDKGMDNVFVDAIKAITTNVTRKRKIITGESFLDYHHDNGETYTVPDVLKTVSLTPNPNKQKILQRKTDKYEPNIILSGDAESFVVAQFLQRQGVCTYDEIGEDSLFVPANYEQRYSETTQEDTINYPDDRLRDIFHEKQTVMSCTKRKLDVTFGRNVTRR